MQKRNIYLILFPLFVMLFIGCNDVEYIAKKTNNIDTNKTQDVEQKQKYFTGKFIDNPVRGMRYKCSSTVSGLTTIDGSFTCLADENVTFSFDTTIFAPLQMSENMIVTPYTLFPSSLTSALNLARVLQTIDTNATNGVITIDKTLELLLPDDINYSSATFKNDVESILKITLIDTKTAHKNLNDYLTKHSISIPDFGVIVPPKVPILLDTTLSIEENKELNSSVGEILVSSVGDANITSMKINGIGNEKFKVSNMGIVTLNAVLDYEEKSQYILEIVATNAIGDSQAKRLTINVQNKAETSPILVDTKLSVLENISSNVNIGNVSIFSSGDTAIQSMTLSDNSTFSIDTKGMLVLKKNVTLDYETMREYNLSVYATNAKGNSESVNLFVYVNNFFDVVASLANSTGNIDENSTSHTNAVNVNILSRGDSNLTFTLSQNDIFEINNDGNITLKEGVTLDYETKSSYSMKVIATNVAGKSNEANITININNIPEVAILQNTTLSIKENKTFGDILGKLSILYAGDTPITDINISGVGHENFIVNNDGTVLLSSQAALDYETKQTYTFSVVATNLAGKSQSITLTVNVEDYLFNPFEVAKLNANDAEANDFFGSSVSMSGDYIVVGSPYEDVDGVVNGGSVYIFKKDANTTIKQIAKIKSNDVEAYDYFGQSVGIDAHHIVVGASAEDTTANDAGSVYLFNIDENDSITQVDKFQANDAQEGDNFGIALGISGAYVVVGASKEDSDAQDSGKVYLFKISDNNASLVDSIKADDAAQNDIFGASLSIDANHIVIGASKKDESATDSGCAYVYKIASDRASLIKKISADDGEDSDYFGTSVSVSGNYVVIGAYQEDTTASNAGSVYLYKITSNTTIIQKAKIQASDASASDYFGYSVSIDGKYIGVGAFGDDLDTQDNGSVYTYKIKDDDTIVSVSKIQASDHKANDYFANAIILKNDFLVIGAFNADTQAKDSGSVYLFDAEPIEKVYLYNKGKNLSTIDEGIVKTIFSIDAASPNGDLTYTVGGGDSDSFIFNQNNLINRNIFDYEQPVDGGNNNNYQYTITLSDTQNKQLQLDLNLSTNNLYAILKHKIVLDDAKESDRFAQSISRSGDYIVVGSPYDDTSATNAGAIFVYKKDGENIILLKKIQADDIQANDYFGKSVSIDSNYIVVGAYKEDTTASNAGSAYLFKIGSDDSITQKVKFQADDSSEDDLFGSVVSLKSKYILVSSPQDNSNTGSAYLFKINNDDSITQKAKIQADDGENEDNFGVSLSLDGNYILIGADSEDTTASNAGSAYLFKINNDDSITQKAKIQADNAGANDYFATSVSMSGNYIVIGANSEDSTATNAGAFYLFKKADDESVTQLSKTQANNLTQNTFFGSTVFIKNDKIAVSAYSSDTQGTLYIFKKANDDTLSQMQEITQNKQGDYFGAAINIDGDYFTVGAYADNTKANDSGAFYDYIKD